MSISKISNAIHKDKTMTLEEFNVIAEMLENIATGKVSFPIDDSLLNDYRNRLKEARNKAKQI